MPYPNDPPRRGEIYWVDFDPARGSEQAGHRPAVVISLDSYNRVMRTVVIAAMTHTVRENSRVSIALPAGQPMRDAGSILAFQVLTIDKSRLEDYAGKISRAQEAEMDSALALSFGLRAP